MSEYIKTENLNIGYGGKSVIKNIALSIEKGETVSIIGPNGSGKSTLLKSVSKQIDIIEGTVFLSGKDLKLIDIKDMSKEVSILLTDRIRTELISCYDVVSAGRYPYTGRMGLLSDKDKEILNWAISICGINELMDKDFSQISDGQKQRVLLGRAIAQEPKLLLLDEPTAYLDIKYKVELFNIINELKKKGTTVIMSLHEVDIAKKISDKIIALKGEEIFAYGRVDEVLSKDTIKEIFELDENSYEIIFN